MAFSPPNRIKRLHINSGHPEKDAGLAFQNTQVYRKAGYSVGTDVKVVGVGSVLVLASQQVDDGLLLELMSVLSASGRDGLGASVATKVRSSGDEGMQITITGPARSIGLDKGRKMVPKNFGRNSGLIVLIPENVDASPIKKAVSMIFEE
ncbi:hypothetical protein [Haloplanus salinus]|jgi:hypothetical protein|uniref:hypothetical protein n=1 Tax=Haloplanus salinus TaxID=1126245 RepID=UPI0011C01DD0|nr:hypothetical protein [Haloplanus salinus]